LVRAAGKRGGGRLCRVTRRGKEGVFNVFQKKENWGEKKYTSRESIAQEDGRKGGKSRRKRVCGLVTGLALKKEKGMGKASLGKNR